MIGSDVGLGATVQGAQNGRALRVADAEATGPRENFEQEGGALHANLGWLIASEGGDWGAWIIISMRPARPQKAPEKRRVAVKAGLLRSLCFP